MTTPQQMQSQVLGYVKQSQQVASQLANTMTGTWAGATGRADRGDRHGDVLPGPAEFVDQMFDFWVQLLEAQRGFVLNGVSALVPSVPALEQVVRSTPSKARPHTTSGHAPVVSPAPSSTTAARTADSTADEHISGAAADAITTAAAITAGKTATITKTPAEKTAAPEMTPSAEAPKKTSTVKQTSAPKMTSGPTKPSAPKKTSAPKKPSTAKQTSAAKQKRS